MPGTLKIFHLDLQQRNAINHADPLSWLRAISHTHTGSVHRRSRRGRG